MKHLLTWLLTVYEKRMKSVLFQREEGRSVAWEIDLTSSHNHIMIDIILSNLLSYRKHSWHIAA